MVKISTIAQVELARASFLANIFILKRESKNKRVVGSWVGYRFTVRIYGDGIDLVGLVGQASKPSIFDLVFGNTKCIVQVEINDGAFAQNI